MAHWCKRTHLWLCLLFIFQWDFQKRYAINSNLTIVWGIFPINQIVSWESHLFGSVAGLFTAYYYRSDGPVKPKAQWEIDEENELLNPTSANETEVEFVNEEPVVPEIKINYTLVEKPSEPTENKGG